MTPSERRRLVFSNLANGVPIERVKHAFRISEKEAMDDFAFVARKVRSYRFERAMPPVACETIREAHDNRIELLLTLTRINTDTEPAYSRIETLPFDLGEGGRRSMAEQKMLELAMRAHSR